jgi:uncharacterized membrane protein YfcA
MSKGKRRRERVVAQGGPRTPAPPKRKKERGFPWPEWLRMPVAAAFALGVVVSGMFVPMVGLALVPVVVVLALLPWTPWFTRAMAMAFSAGVGLLFLLAPTDLGVVLGLVALALLGIVSGHYLSTRVLRPLLERQQARG